MSLSEIRSSQKPLQGVSRSTKGTHSLVLIKMRSVHLQEPAGVDGGRNGVGVGVGRSCYIPPEEDLHAARWRCALAFTFLSATFHYTEML